MAHNYTPGLKASRRIRHRCRRLLPIAGEVLVQPGDRVSAQDVVARTFMPGDVTPINLANALSLPPADIPDCLLKEEGSRVEVGEPLARTPGIFGFFKKEYKSKVAGTIESISSVTGQLILRGEPTPVEVLAYLSGNVVDVTANEGVEMEGDVTFVQGIFGIGGEAFGPIRMACLDHAEELNADLIKPDMKGSVVVGGARMTGKAVYRARDVGVAAIVSGGMDDADLREILGYDLGVAITGSEQVGITLIITEGFGEIAMARRTFALLKDREGDEAAVSGATQIRAGVQRPEIVIPLTEEEKQREREPEHTRGILDVGTIVRVIRDPHFGLIGTVAELPQALQTLESGSKARVLTVEFEGDQRTIVPRANVELIET